MNEDMQKWQYKTLTVNPDNEHIDNKLNAIARDGWELQFINQLPLDLNGYTVFVFRRALLPRGSFE